LQAKLHKQKGEQETIEQDCSYFGLRYFLLTVSRWEFLWCCCIHL